MKQYIDLCYRIINDGVWVENARTGQRCLTIINADLVYDMREGVLPILTTKKVAWESAIAEFLGYLKGFQYAHQFRDLGCNTWNANANENDAWLLNRYREGEDHMGRCYGVQGRAWKNFKGETFDQLAKIYTDLEIGIDNRSEIMTFWNPGELHMACLNSCVHTHTFSLINGQLDLTSYQRSDDIPLGHAFNQVQLGMFLMLMAQITGNSPGFVYHKVVNAHIYENQLLLLVDQLKRKPMNQPVLTINPEVRHIKDLEWISLDDFALDGYLCHPAIKFPFAV